MQIRAYIRPISEYLVKDGEITPPVTLLGDILALKALIQGFVEGVLEDNYGDALAIDGLDLPIKDILSIDFDAPTEIIPLSPKRMGNSCLRWDTKRWTLDDGTALEGVFFEESDIQDIKHWLAGDRKVGLHLGRYFVEEREGLIHVGCVRTTRKWLLEKVIPRVEQIGVGNRIYYPYDLANFSSLVARAFKMTVAQASEKIRNGKVKLDGKVLKTPRTRVPCWLGGRVLKIGRKTVVVSSR